LPSLAAAAEKRSPATWGLRHQATAISPASRAFRTASWPHIALLRGVLTGILGDPGGIGKNRDTTEGEERSRNQEEERCPQILAQRMEHGSENEPPITQRGRAATLVVFRHRDDEF